MTEALKDTLLEKAELRLASELGLVASTCLSFQLAATLSD